MNTETDRFRRRLEQELAALAEEDEARASERAAVALDQQMVGRLSRMDAMQQQAMARAASERRRARIARIRAALRRIEEGEFGYCPDCGEEIEPARLAQDPTVPLCLSCARG